MLLQIHAPHFTAGLYTAEDSETIVGGADIIKYMRHWTVDKVRLYCQRRGWTLEIVSSD